jgi:DNA-binding transcriptional LysR family regulator
MDLRQLEILCAVAETGSFTGAGEKLHVSQSAISRQVLLLERDLKEPLFLRRGHHVVITPAGEALVALGRRVFGDISETVRDITDRQQLRGRVRVAGGMTVCLYVFPPLLREFRSAHPQVEIRVVTGAMPLLLRQLRAGTVDVAFLTLPVDDSNLDSIAVMREELMLVMPSDHPLAGQARVLPRDLVRQPFVLFEPGSNTRHVIDGFFAQARIEPRIVLETENVEIIKALVRIGMGLTVIPYQAIDREVRSGQLACARVKGVRLERETGWVFAKTPRRPRILEELFRAFEEVRPRLNLEPDGRREETPKKVKGHG